ncbi:hypothetical protein BGE01nite_14880 [Brevifollis gellanilyticus]|uniref:Verru_Chthon cassette protein B n=1 Tax=Brevifollis gellanilyticus TaxID=748831 RepID=A0A512M634_9BACT|nr:hypothetical protein BGE01nite_14880 [Brevifollis gellanilyticus]
MKAGFSLVEVVLAVGIMALGVVTILGLLPHGLEMSRKTANEQAQTRIVDQITGELQASSWATLGGLIGQGGGSSMVLQYDDQGLRTRDSALATYIARVSLQDPQESTTGMQMPGNTGAPTNPNLRRVRIEVATSQDPNFNFSNPPPAAPVKRFTSLIAKMRP